ncbi:hypothetical protein [Lautropia mirabilis]|uniref:hypothetical protein n=1 Tax=Lautropia mirabilis TaxID=47671 RepID=UPI0028D7DA1F|nr:hypothetical protein [Lautropia mirabilis]
MSTEATPPSPVPDTTPASAEASTPDTPAAPEQKPAAEVPPPLPLPPEAEELDARVAAALVMVNHGIRRLSKLAGNIRFAFLQRDESRLVTERQKLKAAFQRQEHGPAELKFGLQALLQKAERMAGSLLYQPQNTAATTQAPSPKPDRSAQAAAPESAPAQQADSPAAAADAIGANATDRAVEAPAADTTATQGNETASPQPDAAGQVSTAAAAPDAATPAPAPAAPALPREKSNQIRQTLRKSMMSLAPAAPLHLQIELAPAFAEAEPDIMAMAARVHALHRQVLGSLKGIQWHSAVHSTLSFEDGRTIEVRFGETGAEQIPEEFCQKQAPAQPARKPGQPGQRHGAPGGKPQGNRRHGSGRPGGKPGEGRQGKAAAGQGQAGNAPDAATQDANAPANRQGRPHGKGRQGQPRRAEGGNRPPRNPADGKQGDNTANAGNRPSQGPRRPRPEQEGRRNHEGRRGGQGERNGRSGGGFPSNSAMADKLRAALGGSFGLGKKDK